MGKSLSLILFFYTILCFIFCNFLRWDLLFLLAFKIILEKQEKRGDIDKLKKYIYGVDWLLSNIFVQLLILFVMYVCVDGSLTTTH